MLRHQSEPLDQSSIDCRLPLAIVHWQFGPREWQQFLEFDKKKRQKEDIRATLVILMIVASVLAIVFFVGALDAFAALLIVAGILALGVSAHFLIQRNRYRRMEVRADGGGDIYITPEGICANGVWFDWGENIAWRLATVTPVLADLGIRLPPGVPGYLEFKCRGRAAGRHPVKIDKKWRVPVPQGKEDEAREVIRYFGKPSATRNKFGLPAD